MTDLTAPHTYYPYGTIVNPQAGATLYRVFDVNNQFIFGWVVVPEDVTMSAGDNLEIDIEGFGFGVELKIIYVADRYSREKRDGIPYKMLYVRPEI